MFTIIKVVNSQLPQVGISVLGKEHSLVSMMAQGLIQSENLFLRNCIGNRLAELLFPQDQFKQPLLVSSTEHKISVILQELSLIKTTLHNEKRCYEFY